MYWPLLCVLSFSIEGRRCGGRLCLVLVVVPCGGNMSDQNENVQLIRGIFPDYDDEFIRQWLRRYNGDVGKVCDYLAQGPRQG